MIPEGYKANFETLLRAANNSDLALMEVTEKASGQPRYALCAVNKIDDEFEFVPLAIMVDGNPYELFNPPV